MRDHTAHLLVTLVDEGGSPVEKAAAHAADAGSDGQSPSAGVFWGPGRLVHPPTRSSSRRCRSTPTNLPLFLWVDFRVERTDDSGTRLYTTGLEALGRSELEASDFPGEPQQLLEFAYNIAHYQLRKGKLINDGDTIGLTDEVQVTAQPRPSMFIVPSPTTGVSARWFLTHVTSFSGVWPWVLPNHNIAMKVYGLGISGSRLRS